MTQKSQQTTNKHTRRDRLAVVTQLAVPLLLVWLALWVGSASPSAAGGRQSEPPLPLTRGVALFGAAAVLSASEAARGEGGGLGAFVGAYPQSQLEDFNTVSEIFECHQPQK
jgi:hypothetical protein